MAESSITLLQGMRGQGKTNAAMVELHNTTPLFAVSLRPKDWTWISLTFHSYNEFVYWAVSRSSSMKRMQVRFQFQKMDEYIQLFNTMAESFQNSTIVIDEADAFYSVSKFEGPLNNLFLGSRNMNLNLYYMVKRPTLIPVLVRSQVDRFIVFRTEEKWDIDYLSSRTRKVFPKDPFKLEVGEAIILIQGQEHATIKRYPKFTTSSGSPEGSTGKRLITLKA